MSQRDPAVLELRDVEKEYTVGRRFLGVGTVRRVHAVSGVSLELFRGETLGLVGESGSGKSTLGRLALRLERPNAGHVWLRGQDITDVSERRLRNIRRELQIVFQDPYSSLNPRRSVGSILGEALTVHRVVPKASVAARIEELLAQVGLPASSVSAYPHQFSGGQRQRIAIARALAVEPSIIICDEPVSALDVSVRGQILNLLSRLQRELGLTYLFIAHDLPVVGWLSDRIAVMYLGKLVKVGPQHEILSAPRHPYTSALIAAAPTLESKGEGASLISGDLPSPMNPPTGCRFKTRCWLRERLGNPVECDREPPLTEVGAGHSVACHFADRTAVQLASALASSS